MKLLLPVPALDFLSQARAVVDPKNLHPNKFKWFVDNLWREKKPEDTRTYHMVEQNSAMGRAPEYLAVTSPFLVEAYPIRENAIGVTYQQRQVDIRLKYRGWPSLGISLKACPKPGSFNCKTKVKNSFIASGEHCELGLLCSSMPVDNTWMVYETKFLFLVDMKRISEYWYYLRKDDRWSFMSNKAVEEEACIDLTKWKPNGNSVLSKSFAGMHRSDGQEITRLSEPQLLGSAS